MSTDRTCPCGSQQPYANCCQPFHDGQLACSPETLMRSRFTAFAMNKPDYLLRTWHPETRPKQLDLMDSPDWTYLEVLGSVESGGRGMVHFRAIFRERGQWGYLEEKSDFVRKDGQWLYVSGDPQQGILKPGRNDRCPCGSGRKYKACCISHNG